MHAESIDSFHIDSNWYSQFEKAGAFQAYEYLDGDKEYRNAQKEQFLQGITENPVLDYPKLDMVRLNNEEETLLNLKRDIVANESDPIIQQVYRWRLNEKIAEIELLKATANGDMKKFKRYSEFVYGKPSEEIFSYTLHGVRELVEESLHSENTDIQRTAQKLIEILPEMPGESPKFTPPTADIILTAQLATLKDMNSSTSIVESSSTKNADEICSAFSEALRTINAEGWETVKDASSKTGISVDQEKKQVKVPADRELSASKLTTLIAHEINTHVGRRLNGERSKLMLLGLGLDRYEKGEEGVATMREQALTNEWDDFAGLEGHLPISLAYGLDGKPRNFREVFTIMEKYFTLKEMVNGKDFQTAEKSAITTAWNRCVRTFRGTDCKTKGTCFTKDIIYREGNIGVWDVVRNNSSELQRFSVGKYDPNNERHIWILNTLGISDSDLANDQKVIPHT